MSAETLRRLVAGEYPDPDGGGMLAVPTRSVVIAESLAGDEADLVAALGLGRRLCVVSDPVTREVLGARVERALAAIGDTTPVVLPGQPHADAATVELVRAASRGADGLVAVGSGTLNDVCKYAAALDGKPYVVFGTAPSMNGYTSVNAAITVDGLKKSLAAAAARGVYLDLAVLAAAPVRLIRAGLGDSLCRPTAQADWLLAHLLRGEPYREAPFALLAEDEARLLAEPEALVRGDRAAIARLARTLVLSGFGMTICGGSYPASQGEHLISHYADMRGAPDWPPSFHGEQIGVTTLTMARLQERLLAGGPPRVGPTRLDAAALAATSGPRWGRPAGGSCRPSGSTWRRPNASTSGWRRTGMPGGRASGRSPGRPRRSTTSCGGPGRRPRRRISAGRGPSTGRPSCTRARSGAATPSSTWPPTPACWTASRAACSLGAR